MGLRSPVPGVGPLCRRIVAEIDDGLDAGWQIVGRLKSSHRTVERVIRQVAVLCRRLTAWNDGGEM